MLNPTSFTDPNTFSEIANYLSCRDMRNLKFAFPKLEIKKQYLKKLPQKIPLESWRLFPKIVSSGKYQYLFYNIRYDPQDDSVSVDLDWASLFDEYHFGYIWLNYFSSEYILNDKYYSIHHNLCPHIIRIRNCQEWNRFVCQKTIIDRRNIQPINQDELILLIKHNLLDIFVKKNLGLYSDLKTYYVYGRHSLYRYEDEYVLRIMNCLPFKNKLSLLGQLKSSQGVYYEFLKNKTSVEIEMDTFHDLSRRI